MGCPENFQDFKTFCAHADKCEVSWKKMVYATIIYDCRSCSQLTKGLKELLVHYLKCNQKIMEEVQEVKMSQSEIKGAIMKNINHVENQQRSNVHSKLMIDVSTFTILEK